MKEVLLHSKMNLDAPILVHSYGGSLDGNIFHFTLSHEKMDYLGKVKILNTQPETHFTFEIYNTHLRAALKDPKTRTEFKLRLLKLLKEKKVEISIELEERWAEELQALSQVVAENSPEMDRGALARKQWVETIREINAQFKLFELDSGETLFIHTFLSVENNPDLETAHRDSGYLLQLFQKVNLEYFQGVLNLGIGWGKQTNNQKKRCSITFGTYHHEEKAITIHSRLKQKDVPIFFIEFIIFHEMLHHLYPPIQKSGKMLHHHEEFKRKEKDYKFYRDALKWEKENLPKLLASS